MMAELQMNKHWRYIFDGADSGDEFNNLGCTVDFTDNLNALVPSITATSA